MGLALLDFGSAFIYYETWVGTSCLSDILSKMIHTFFLNMKTIFYQITKPNILIYLTGWVLWSISELYLTSFVSQCSLDWLFSPGWLEIWAVLLQDDLLGCNYVHARIADVQERKQRKLKISLSFVIEKLVWTCGQQK